MPNFNYSPYSNIVFRIQIILIFFIGIQPLSSQDFRIPFRQGNQWGYADNQGNVTTLPQYDSVAFYHNNLRWFVFKNDKVGVVDMQGNEIMPPQYDSIYEDPLHSEYHDYYVMKNNKEGYASIQGKWILPIQYQRVINCRSPLRKHVYMFLIQEGERWKIIDDKQKIYLDEIQEFKEFYEGHYALLIDNKWGVYDVVLKDWLIKPTLNSIRTLSSMPRDHFIKKEYIGYEYLANNNQHFFLLDKNFNQTLDATFQDVQELYYSEEESKKQHLNYTDQEIFTLKPDNLQLVSIDSLQAKDINEEYDKSLSADTYDIGNVKSIKYRKEKSVFFFAYTSGQNRWNVETTVVEETFRSVQLIANVMTHDIVLNINYLIAKKKNKWGVFDLDNNTWVVPPKYNKITTFYSQPYGYLLLHKKNKIDLFDYNTNKYISGAYDEFIGVRGTSSLDNSYKNFDTYFFKKNKKTCIVGENSVRFFNP
jgi:hypothetical protein